MERPAVEYEDEETRSMFHAPALLYREKEDLRLPSQEQGMFLPAAGTAGGLAGKSPARVSNGSPAMLSGIENVRPRRDSRDVTLKLPSSAFERFPPRVSATCKGSGFAGQQSPSTQVRAPSPTPVATQYPAAAIYRSLTEPLGFLVLIGMGESVNVDPQPVVKASPKSPREQRLHQSLF